MTSKEPTPLAQLPILVLNSPSGDPDMQGREEDEDEESSQEQERPVKHWIIIYSHIVGSVVIIGDLMYGYEKN